MLASGNGQGAGPLPFGRSHDDFLELCALSTTEVLTANERAYLDHHLSECSECREALAQYQALTTTGVPLMTDTGCASDSVWQVHAAEASLLARIAAGETATERFRNNGSPPFDCRTASLSLQPPTPSVLPWRHIWWQFAAALLLICALGYRIYRTGIDRGIHTAGIRRHATLSSSSATDGWLGLRMIITSSKLAKSRGRRPSLLHS